MLALLLKLVLVLFYHALLEFTFTKLWRAGTRTDLLALERDTLGLRECPVWKLSLLEMLWMLPFHFTGPLKGLLSLGSAASQLGPNQHLR